MNLVSTCQKVLDQLNEGDMNEVQPDLSELLRQALGSTDSRDYQRLWDEFMGYGPLNDLWRDEEITEIILNGPENIWLERRGQFSKLNDRFLSEATFNTFLFKLCELGQMVTDLNTPLADGRVDDFRVHLIRPPLCQTPQISLRRHPKNSWTLEKLVQDDWACQEAIELIRDKIEKRENLLIVGPTGAGKTAVLNACLQCVHPNSRVICIEDTSELNPPNSASCKLLTRTDTNGCLKDYSLSDLIRQSLRMRPSRLIVGEVRGGEAKDLLLALATGHSGSMGTLHASDARQALLRLEMLVQMGAPHWSLDSIRKLIHLSLDSILVVKMDGGKRRLEGIYEITSLESVGLLLQKSA